MDRKQRRSVRRYVFGVAVVAMLVTTLGVAANAQQDEADVYTGCLNEASGTLSRVAVGFEPAMPCGPSQVEISWDRSGPASDARIAALEERVANETVGAPSGVRLFAAATVDVTNIESSVGPLESVTQIGAGHYRVAFSEDAFGDIAPRTTAFISLASNSAIDTPSPCFYEVVDSRTLDVRCYDLGSTGDEQPEDAEWSLIIFTAT